MQKKKQGISLIVLVITMIIMIILASAVMLTLSNSNIIERADEGVSETNLSQIQQLATIGWLEAYADGKRSQMELQTAVIEYLNANGVTDSALNEYSVIVTTENVTVEVGDALEGTWIWQIQTIGVTAPEKEGYTFVFNYVSNSTEYNSLTILPNDEHQELEDIDDSVANISYEEAIVWDGKVWEAEEYKTITITSKLAEVENGELLLKWLTAKAKKQ